MLGYNYLPPIKLSPLGVSSDPNQTLHYIDRSTSGLVSTGNRLQFVQVIVQQTSDYLLTVTPEWSMRLFYF